MKKLPIFLTSLMVSTTALASGDPEFINFAVEQAHSKNFHGCDASIKEAHRNASGKDIRVNVSSFPGVTNMLDMTTVYGSKDDTVKLKSTFVKEGGKCFYVSTATITVNKTCLSYVSENSSFKYTAETGDYIWLKTTGGITMTTQNVNGYCVVDFNGDGIN